MTFRVASAQTFQAAGSLTITTNAPVGTISTDTVMAVVSWGTSASQTISVAGATTVVAAHNDTNFGWGIYKITGKVAGDPIVATFAVSTLNLVMQLFVFTEDLGATIGTVGNRGATSTAVTVAPAIAATVGQPILCVALERTTATGTTISSVVNSTGATVSQLSYVEKAGDPDVSIYVGRFVATANPSGTVTVTHSSASTNGGAVLFFETVPASTTPTASPVFTITPSFTASANDPNAPAAYKAASALVTTAVAPSLTVPVGTVASDYVYALVAWGTPTVQTIGVSAPAAAVSSATVAVAGRADTNLGWSVLRFTGLVAGDVVVTTATGAGLYEGKLFVFDKVLAPSGVPGGRTGSSASTVIPTVGTVAGKPVYLFAVERTLADGTAVSSANNANGTTVTALSYSESAVDPDVSIYLGRLTPPTADTGATTLVYTSGSGNGAGVAIPSAGAPATAAPVFTLSALFAVKRTTATGLLRVYLGRPDSDTIRVKALTSGAASVVLAVSSASDMSSAVLGSAVVPDADGYSALTVGALLADHPYYWQVRVDGVAAGTINSTRTWPLPGAAASFGLLVGACTKAFGVSTGPSNPDTFTFMRTKTDAAGQPARLFVDLGDDIYPASHGSPGGDVVPGHPVIIRNWWETQHQQSERAAFHKAIPTAHTYSDNDFVGSNSDSTVDPYVGGVVNAVRRQVLSDGPGGATDGKGLYWSALIGRVLLIHTDSRTYSSNVLLSNGTPGKSMLGATQKAWLKAQMARVDHSGIIWFHDNQWVGSPAVSSARPGVDNWQAFSTERQEIADYITTNKIRLMLYIHGDNHGMAYDNGTNNAYGGFPWAMVAPIYQDAQTVTLATSGDAYPLSNVTNQKYFTWLEITDNGTTVSVNLTGYNVTGGVLEPLISGRVVSAGSGARLHQQFFGTLSSSDVS